jgi:hypothetical protein
MPASRTAPRTASAAATTTSIGAPVDGCAAASRASRPRTSRNEAVADAIARPANTFDANGHRRRRFMAPTLGQRRARNREMRHIGGRVGDATRFSQPGGASAARRAAGYERGIPRATPAPRSCARLPRSDRRMRRDPHPTWFESSIRCARASDDVARHTSKRAPVSAVAHSHSRSAGRAGITEKSSCRSFSLFSVNTRTTSSWLTGGASSTPTS